ncbi:Heterogeneous nuclear ribonucleoprotein U-like protein 2, partial [Pseudolycoriella hygida]
MDPAKLKVVELRQELASRGLDQKGVKAVLVARLKEALDAENASNAADQNVVEASSSQKEEEEQTPMDVEPEKVAEDQKQSSVETSDVVEDVPSETVDSVPVHQDPVDSVPVHQDPVDSVPVHQDPEVLPEQSTQEQNEQSEAKEVEPMDTNDDANIEVKNDSVISEDIPLKAD